MSRFGCTTPWGTNKDHICSNQTIGLQAHALYKAYFYHKTASRFTECPKPCNTMKLLAVNEREENQSYINGLASARLFFKFSDLITVTNEYYSYIWLNLVAEAGGYVGLFLGFSVYQITDLLDKFMK